MTMRIGRQHAENVKNGLRRHAVILGTLLALLWLLEIADLILPGQVLDAYGGIQPRTWNGLRNIFIAPFLHNGIGHLIANTFPFLILGWFVMLRRVREFLAVSVIAGVVSGLGIWLFGGVNTLHVGISGVVFGYLGFLLLRGYFERSIPAIALALITLFFYGSMIWGVFPIRYGISWQGHLFGFMGGGIAAYWLADRNAAAVTLPDVRKALRLLQKP